MSKHNEIRDLVFAAILIALTVLLSLPYLVIPTGSGAAFTVAHIPVLIGSVILGKKYGALLGAVMGISSLVIASFFLGPNAPFTNPLVSVLPRVFFGWVTYIVYSFFQKLIKIRHVAVGISLGVSTLIHSLVVLPLLYWVAKTGFYFTALENPATLNQNILPFIYTILVANGIFEIIAAIVVGTPIILVMDQVMSNNEELEDE